MKSATEKATASGGTCNVAHSGSNDVITIRNCGIGKEQADKIIALLKAALSNRDVSAINGKLDELLEIAGKSQQTTVNAPIAQQNSGGCSQQVVGGNNNIVNCVSPEHFGNLSDRAVALSNEILGALNMQGWNKSGPQDVQPKWDEIEQRERSRSNSFRFKFLQRVVNIRNEFAQSHIEDEKLDELLDIEAKMEQSSRLMAASGHQGNVPSFPSQLIKEVAERLKVLASHAKQRESARSLTFSEAPIQPQPPQFPFNTVVTITTDAILSHGYIVTEFNDAPQIVATDLIDSNVVSPYNVEGNKPLNDYLLSAGPMQSYVVEIGKSSITPKQPFHVFARSGTASIHVTKVTWFDE